MFGAALVQRELTLASIALLAAVSALAIAGLRDTGASGAGLPEAVPAPGGGWYTALAGVGRATRGERRTACGHTLGPASLGVAHPVLPCDVKIFISYNGREVLTQVIDRGPYVPGRAFDLTKALADLLGLRGTQPIRWRYAR
jgi:Lytic transglycolase